MWLFQTSCSCPFSSRLSTMYVLDENSILLVVDLLMFIFVLPYVSCRLILCLLCGYKTFSHSIDCLFHFGGVFLCLYGRLLIWWILLVSSWDPFLFCLGPSRKSLSMTFECSVLPRFSSASFKVPGLILRSLIHFMMCVCVHVSLCRMGEMALVSFFNMKIQLSHHPGWRCWLSLIHVWHRCRTLDVWL